MSSRGLLISSDNTLSNYNKYDDIDFVFIRVGFTDFDRNKTKNIDIKFYDNYRIAKNKKLKIGVYYVSCATNITEANDEIKYLLNIINDIKINYPIIIQIEDNHNTVIYHPYSQKNMSKNDLLKLVIFQTNELKKYGYDSIIKTYETWYKNIFKGKINNVNYFLDNNVEYFDDIYFLSNDKVINNVKDKYVKIEILVKENNLLQKFKNNFKKVIKLFKKIGKK